MNPYPMQTMILTVMHVIIVKQVLTYLHARMNRLSLCASN